MYEQRREAYSWGMTEVEHPPVQSAELADERDRLADERDQLADERDRLADDRDRLADERERNADERDQLANEHERLTVVDLSADGAFRGSRLRLLESEQTLDHAERALDRSRATLALRQLSVESDDNSVRQQQLDVSREMLLSRKAKTANEEP
ncbi:MAG: hypothetical protein QOD91_606 [Frankiales bacterium]|nr:hypothetical protein [Frankiales bacterium]